MTSAPSHASIWVHDVPASNWVRSRMRMPFSAVLMVFLPYRDDTPTRPEFGSGPFLKDLLREIVVLVEGLDAHGRGASPHPLLQGAKRLGLAVDGDLNGRREFVPEVALGGV